MPLLYLPRFFAVTSAGVPYPFARLYTYKAGTLTALSTFTDETFGTPLSNPVTADTNGLFPSIHFDAASGFNMRCILKDRNDVLIWDEDNLPRSQTVFSGINSSGGVTGTSGSFSGILQGYPIAISGTSPYLEVFESDAAADQRRFHLEQIGGVMRITTKTDAGADGKDVLNATRGTGTAIATIAIGNSSDLPAITINGESATPLTSTFTGTLTGMTASTTGTVTYQKFGRFAALSAAFSGTSNSTAMTMTGLPAAITPPTLASVVPCLVKDNGVASLAAWCSINTSGVISFGLGSTPNFSGFTNSGSKGIGPNWNIIYNLY